MLAAIVRVADKIYLTPNLKRSNIIVNSKTVGERLKKYNGISNFRIINPGCNLPSHNQKTILSHDLKKRDGSQLLLAFSRLNIIQKGIGTIIETASILPSYQFIIAGPDDATLKTFGMKRIPSNVHFMAKEFSEYRS